MILQLAAELSRDYVMQRIQNPQGRRTADLALMKKFFGIKDPPREILQVEGNVQGRCGICKLDKKPKAANRL